jgi:hypothetical protein
MIGIYGPAAPMTVNSWDTPCYHTALIRSYSDYVIRKLDLQKYTHYVKPSNQIVITYMLRKGTSMWPEEKYCNDTESFFSCKLWENFGPRAIGRTVSNDNDVINMLRNIKYNDIYKDNMNSKTLENLGNFEILKKRNFEYNVSIKFQAVDYNEFNFLEQVIYLYIYKRTYASENTYIHACIHIFIHLIICMYEYMTIHIHVNISIYIYIYVCIYIYLYLHIYIQIKIDLETDIMIGLHIHD